MKDKTKKLNGLDTRQMFETIEGLRVDPSHGRFQFRAQNRWIDGGANRSTIQGFYGGGREDDSRKEPFEFVAGEPPILLGANEGANPVEFLLHSLAGCVTTALVLHATARGITIRSISTEIEGELDLRGLVALGDVFPGYERIRIEMDIDADCSDQELDELLAFSQAHSPVYRTVTQPVPVVVERASRVAARS